VELCRKHGLYELPADANFVHVLAVLLWDMDSEMSCIFQESPSYHCDFWDCTSCFWMVIVCHWVSLFQNLNFIVLEQGILNAQYCVLTVELW